MLTMRCRKFLAATVAIVVSLQLTGPANAARDGWGWVDSFENLIDSVSEVLMAPFSDEGIDMVSPPVTMRQASEGATRDPFWHHLEEAGYEFKEAKAQVGLIPGLEIEFVLVLELSEADRDSLERKLEIDAKQRPGLLSMIKRRIINTLLDASDFEEMRVEELTITLLPLPSAVFSLAPVEAPLGEEHDLIYRALQNMMNQTKSLNRGLGGRGIDGAINYNFEREEAQADDRPKAIYWRWPWESRPKFTLSEAVK